MTDDQSFIAQLAKDHGIAESATIENHQITQKDTDHDGKEKKVEIRAFEDDDGGHIRVVGIENGMVHFGEFRDGATDE